MTDAVSVQPPKPSWWEQSSIKRAIDVASGRVPTASQTPQKQQYGINYLGSQLGGIQEGALRGLFNAGDAVSRFVSGRPGAPVGRGFGDLMYDPVAAQSALGGGPLPTPATRAPYTGQMDFPQAGSQYYIPGAEEAFRDQTAQLVAQKRAEEEAANQPAPTDWLAQAMGILGGGPDYSAYRSALEDMVLNPTTGLSPRLQAMYNELAARAGENQQRISDIYGGATENVGSIYDTSAANVSDAFTSSQQQAADQMARLGVEAAAPGVLPQAANRQASALAALEQERAGGLSALERYGASSGDFASQMGQAAQQRGVEQNEFLLGALQRQLAESLGMEAQGAYDARLRAPGLARDLFEASQLGQPQGPTFEQQLAADRFAFDQGKTAADMQVQAQQNRQTRYQQLFEFYNGNAKKAEEQLLYEIEQGRI